MHPARTNYRFCVFLAIMVCCSRFRLGSSYSPKQTLTFNRLEFVFAGRVNAPLVAVMAAMTARTKNSLEEEVTSHFSISIKGLFTLLCVLNYGLTISPGFHWTQTKVQT